MTASPCTIPLRAALYLRVSTARQAEHDVSIPDQRRQGEAYCLSRGYGLVETRDELPPHRGKIGAALRPFEQDHVKLALDLVQPAAQGGLAYIQGFSRLSQAAVLGRHDSQSQITKLYIHTTHFIGLMGRLSQILPPLASPP